VTEREWKNLQSKHGLNRASWNRNSSDDWTVHITWPDSSECSRYAYCGPSGYCDYTETAPACKCLDGFQLQTRENGAAASSHKAAGERTRCAAVMVSWRCRVWRCPTSLCASGKRPLRSVQQQLFLCGIRIRKLEQQWGQRWCDKVSGVDWRSVSRHAEDRYYVKGRV
jgi:hypothetical protein